MAKRRRKKKSGGKRKASRRRKHARKSPRRRRSHRRSKRSGKVIVLRRKGQSVRIKRNPVKRYSSTKLDSQLEKYTGLHAEEVGSLLIGGALYGTVDSLLQKYIPQAYTMAAQIPVIGTTAIPLLAAVGVKMLNKGKIKPVDMVCEGLIGAAIVAMGVQASHLIPGLAPAAPAQTAGVDYTPGRGVMMGYARDGADFGNVDFTPGPGVMMGAQPQLGMQAQMGSSNASRNGADFGLIPSGLGEMGLVPEGLGGLG